MKKFFILLFLINICSIIKSGGGQPCLVGSTCPSGYYCDWSGLSLMPGKCVKNA